MLNEKHPGKNGAIAVIYETKSHKWSVRVYKVMYPDGTPHAYSCGAKTFDARADITNSILNKMLETGRATVLKNQNSNKITPLIEEGRGADESRL